MLNANNDINIINFILTRLECIVDKSSCLLLLSCAFILYLLKLLLPSWTYWWWWRLRMVWSNVTYYSLSLFSSSWRNWWSLQTRSPKIPASLSAVDSGWLWTLYLISSAWSTITRFSWRLIHFTSNYYITIITLSFKMRNVDQHTSHLMSFIIFTSGTDSLCLLDVSHNLIFENYALY